MRRTVFIYLLATFATLFFWVTRQNGGSKALLGLLWLTAPLLFVFVYSRFLFAGFSPLTSRFRHAAILHGLGAATTTSLFVILGSQFWENPMHDADSFLLLAVHIVAPALFCVAALSLLFKNRSTLAKVASFLFWPYWLLLALAFVDRFFEASIFRTAFCFLCLFSSVLFAFAAGAISHRPVIGHSSALAGLVGMPWIYWMALRDTPLGNMWTEFNLADEISYNNLRLTELTIFSVALIVLAITTAALRLLPPRWSLRGLPICERTWPACCATLLFLAIWFSQSVLPYRISGAVDYASWPILQILRVEKRGLQFHETCISVWGYRNHPESVSFSANDRRLFQYRFQQKNASGELPEPLRVRIQSIMKFSDRPTPNWATVKPLRAWNEDGWYFSAEGIGLAAYTTGNGTTPPQEIVDLFNELQKVPHAQETQSDRKDVCLGFCYDPLSGLGLLYANHRCRYDGHDYVCR